MKTNPQPKVFVRILALTVLAAGTFSVPPHAQGQTFKVLYSFTGGADGAEPYSTLLFDKAGNLYGTTFLGGEAGCFYETCGVVFALTPGSEGWSEATLHAFAGGSDGGNPRDTLIFDATGNLYGTTEVGGDSGCTDYGCGVAFELTPTPDGWDESVLYRFSQAGSSGGSPVAALVSDKHGHLYSTLPTAGSEGMGTVYELTNDMGGWTERTIYDFGNGLTGCDPAAAPIFDVAGNLYGTAPLCGPKYNTGTIFELAKGSRKERTLYAFDGLSGSEPWSGLIFDKVGNLYGTTRFGGKYNKGTVFRLMLGARGKWKAAVLHSFKGGTTASTPSAP